MVADARRRTFATAIAAQGLAELAPGLVDALGGAQPGPGSCTPGQIGGRTGCSGHPSRRSVSIAILGRPVGGGVGGSTRPCEAMVRAAAASDGDRSGGKVRLVLVRVDMPSHPQSWNVVEERRSNALGDVVSSPPRCAAGRRSPAPHAAGAPQRAFASESVLHAGDRRGRRLDHAHRGLVDAVEDPANSPRGGDEREGDRHRDEQTYDGVRAGKPASADRAATTRATSTRRSGRADRRQRGPLSRSPSHADPVDRYRLVAQEPDHPCAEHDPDVIERRRDAAAGRSPRRPRHGRHGDHPHDRQPARSSAR